MMLTGEDVVVIRTKSLFEWFSEVRVLLSGYLAGPFLKFDANKELRKPRHKLVPLTKPCQADARYHPIAP